MTTAGAGDLTGFDQVGLTDRLAEASHVLAETIGIDAHIDTVQHVLVMAEDLDTRRNVGHVDIPRLREGGIRAPFFALWFPVFFRGAEAVRRTLDLRDAMQSVFDAHPDEIELATTAASYPADREGAEDSGVPHN